MNFKNTLAVSIMLLSFGAHAIPPLPPSVIYNKIRTLAAKNCMTDNGLRVSDLKDSGSIKFVLELDKNSTTGTLTMMEDGTAIETFIVTCTK